MDFACTSFGSHTYFLHKSVTITPINSDVNKQITIPHYWHWFLKALKRDSKPENWMVKLDP